MSDYLSASSVSLNQLLGTGRHGSVFAATFAPTGASVAVKIPIDGLAASEEARALKRFSHDHVVSLVAGPLDNGALVLELCDGGTLADRVETDALTLGEIITVGQHVLDALEHVHHLGWVHGDVAPPNIGLRADGSAALFDFGTARPIGDEPITEGTPEFLGPLRTPNPTLDLRALAASLLCAARTMTRWDSAGVVVADRLDRYVERADAGAEVTAAELRDLLDADAELVRPAEHRAFGSGHTASFGPRPTRVEAPPAAARRARWPAVVAVFVLATVLVTGEVDGGPPVGAPSLTAESTPTTQPTTVVEPVASLADHDASWDERTGRLRIALAEIDQVLDVGRPGDQAAIADWDCDGLATLGVYRPATGAWFVFDSWAIDAAARPHVDLRRAGDLAIALDARGCAAPIVRG